MGVDADGNVYSAGLFQNTVDFDPGPGVFNLTGAAIEELGIYISKLDANGNFVWAIQIPTYVEFGQIELKVDKSGNVYIASTLNTPADMDPGPGVHMISPTGGRDAFVAKYDTDGNLVWADQFGGPGDTVPEASTIALDKDNNVLVGGSFNNTVDFDPGPGVFNLTSSVHIQTFLVKLSNSGELMWVKQMGCTFTDIKYDVSGNIVTTGVFGGMVDFDPGPGENNVTASPGSIGDGFICKFDADGNFIWVKTLREKNGDNNYYSHPTGLDIDGLNNIVISGYFIGNIDFDPGPGEFSFFSNPHDCFVLKLDKNGNFVWAKIIGGSADMDTGNDVAVDAANNVYLLGAFGPEVDYDPGPGEHFIYDIAYGPSAVIKFTPGGDFVYAAPFLNTEYSSSLFRRMDIDPAGNIYITGVASGIIDADPGAGIFPLYGPFVIKLAPCANPTTATLNISACSSYTLNNQTFDSTGTYLVSMLNSLGCDSLITVNLTINKKSTAQTKVICQGETLYVGGKYQTVSGIYLDTLQTSLGCDSVIATTLTVNPKPSPDLGADQNICSNTTLSLSPGTGFTSYQWQDDSQDPTLNVSNTGLFWVKVTNSFHCETTDSIRILSLISPPSNFLPARDSICSYTALNLSPTASYSSYQWSTGEKTKSIAVQQTGAYWLQVTNTEGCKGMDTITVLPKQCMFGVYIPSAFTPDDNGKNDTFRALVFGKLTQFHLQVFNRWGSLIFQTKDPAKGWDGKLKGVTTDTGVFVWICSWQMEGLAPEIKKGTVTLIR